MTLSAGIIANQLRFHRSGYTPAGGTLTLDGTTPTLFAGLGEAATIHSLILGSDGLTKTGGGTIRLASCNTYTGQTTISNGSLIISNRRALGVDASAIVVTTAGTSCRCSWSALACQAVSCARGLRHGRLWFVGP